MGFRNKMMNKVDNYKSRHSEKSDIGDMNSEIAANKEHIDEKLMELGLFYWNLYSENSDFKPLPGSEEIFAAIEDYTNEIGRLTEEIENRKISGAEERSKIDEDTALREEEEKRLKEESRKLKEELRAAKRAQKEAEKTGEKEEDLFDDDLE